MRTNRVFVPLSLQSSPVLGKKEVLLTFSPPFTDAARKPDEAPLEKDKNFFFLTTGFYIFLDHCT